MTSYQANSPVPVEGYGVAVGTSSSDPFIAVFSQRDPTVYDFNYPVKKRWINLSQVREWILTGFNNSTGQNLAIWIELTGGGVLSTLSDNDVFNTVSPSASNANPPDNVQLTGLVNEQTTPFLTVIANPANHSIAFNPMSSTRWIVDPLGVNGTHTTIQSAINSATAGDDILIMTNLQNQAYNENLTLTTGVNLTGFNGDNLTGQVVVNGTLTYNTNGPISISNISFTIDSSNNLVNCLPTGVNTSVMNFSNCSFTANGTASYFLINANSVSASSVLSFVNCNFDLPNPNAAYFANNGNGSMSFVNCFLGNSGGSTVYSACLSGIVNATNSQFSAPLQFAGSGAGTLDGCVLNTEPINFNAISFFGATGALGCKYCRFLTGSANAIALASPSVLNFQFCEIYNTGQYGIGGNGTLEFSPISFTNTTDLIDPALTLTATSFGPIVRISPTSGSVSSQIYCGTGTPNLNIVAPTGSLFIRTDASSSTTRLYINTNGANGWTNITCAA
jgi:hypothetical protein